MKLALIFLIGATLAARSAEAANWRWSLSGEGVAASGTFTTSDKPDANGFLEITGVEGEMNGVAIAGLQAPGTSIPLNEGYPVDNLVRTAAPQLSVNGFGFKLADGTYANPFYATHFARPGDYAFLSDPANRRTSEPAVTFTATIVP